MQCQPALVFFVRNMHQTVVLYDDEINSILIIFSCRSLGIDFKAWIFDSDQKASDKKNIQGIDI